MNWKLLFQLSLFGLVMAFGTISLIPYKFEPIFWIVVFSLCSWFIAKTCLAKYFQYGFVLSLFNCVWITVVHVIFYSSYASHHPEVVQMFQSGPLHNHPRIQMLIFGPFFGVLSGLIQGLFAFIASKIVKKSIIVQ